MNYQNFILMILFGTSCLISMLMFAKDMWSHIIEQLIHYLMVSENCSCEYNAHVQHIQYG